MIRRLLPLLLLLSCGYTAGIELQGVETLQVAMPVNHTRWRGIEADLSAALRRELHRSTAMRVADGGDAILRTKIERILHNSPVGASRGGAALARTHLNVAWSLESPSGDVLTSGTVSRRQEYLPGAEQAADALGEIVDDLAEMVVMEMGLGALAAPEANR